MKTYLLLLISVVVVLNSCKKEGIKTENSKGQAVNAAGVVAKLYPVSLTVTGITTAASQTTNSLKINALSDQIKYLHYYVFKGNFEPISDAFLLKQKTQGPASSNFGTLTDSLPAGTYKIFLVGAQSPAYVVQERKVATDYYGDPIFYYNNSNIYQTFYKEVDLDITGPVNQSVALTRAIAMVTVKITDTMPANAFTMKISFEDFPRGFDLKENIGNPHGHDQFDFYPKAYFKYPVTGADRGNTGFTFSTLVWGHNYPTIRVTCLDAGGKELASKIIADNYFEIDTNKEYTFTGKLFDTGTTFQISIDDSWNPPVTVPFSTPVFQ